MITHIFFDIGGVLIKLLPGRMMEHLRECAGISEPDLEQALYGPGLRAYETGELTDEQFFNYYQDAIPKPNGLTREDFFRAWLLLLGGPTQTLTLARQLSKDFPVWLASNTNPYHIRHGERKGYFSGFAGTIYSFEIGARKPSAEFFQKALDRAASSAVSSLFIDDKEENVEAARTMGFHAILYQSDSQIRQDLDLIATKTPRH